MMKNLVLAGIVALFGLAAEAQVFKKGDVVEINKNLSDEGKFTWVTGNVVDIDLSKKEYTIRSTDKNVYTIPFAKEDRWIRKPAQPLTLTMAAKDNGMECNPSVELLKQKIREEFETDFSEYDSVTISYNNIEALDSYKNTDKDFGKMDASIYPFNVDFTVRLVSTQSDGTQRKINWQFKRKYLLHQNLRGKCSLTMAEKEESLLSHI